MHIAVTGATGFLGRYIVRQLAGSGHRLRCWFRPNSDRSGLDDSRAVQWLPGQLGENRSTTELVRDVDAVVHSALNWQRQGGFRASAGDELIPFAEANLMGSLKLFQAAHSAGVPRFIFISTCAVHE